MDYKQAARSHEFNKKHGSISSLINKSTIDSFEAGYEFCKKEYEERLRWIPIEEKLPEKIHKEPSVSKVVQVKTKRFNEPFCAYYNYNLECWLSYPYGSCEKIIGISEWRYFL